MKVRYECPGCSRVSEVYDNACDPPGWFYSQLYFDGSVRTIAACSADCINAAREHAKQHYMTRARGFCDRIDRAVFRKGEPQ